MSGLGLFRRTSIVVATALALPLGAAMAATAGPGAPGIGDPYYPDYGNGGYDVSHYDLALKYQPATDTLQGTARITARATQDLNRFDLDFLLDTQAVTVNGRKAAFTTSGAHELVITPTHAVRKGARLDITVTYSGVPS